MNNNVKKPFFLAEWILESITDTNIRYSAMGDFFEAFNFYYENKGRLYAHSWFWIQIIRSFPRFIYDTIFWSIVMFKNYILVALRNMKRQKIHSFINILGLAVGMAGFAVFGLLVGTKFNAEQFHKNADRIYGVVQITKDGNNEERHTAFTPAPMLTELQNELPEISDGIRILSPGVITIKKENESFYEERALFVDPNFFSFFTFNMKTGNPLSALSSPNSIVLTEKLAVKYFGNEDPIGKTLTLNKNTEVTVTGVAENTKRTSSLRFDFLISMEAAKQLSADLDKWDQNTTLTFILVEDGTEKVVLDNKLITFKDKFFSPLEEPPEQIYVFPLLDFRMRSEHISTIFSQAPAPAIYASFYLGLLLLIVVSINFMNMTTARYLNRTKEIGLRKVIGARRFQLIKQFMGESLLFSLIALPLAIIIFEMVQPLIDSNLGDLYGVSNTIWNYPFLLKYMLLASIITGLVSGLYPAFFLSAFQPDKIIRGNFLSGKRGSKGRKSLIIIQFTLSIMFIAFAGILKKQMNHIFNTELGFITENIAVVDLPPDQNNIYNIIKNDLSQRSDITSLTGSEGMPIEWYNSEDAYPIGLSEEDAITVHSYGVDYDFIETMKIEILEGRSLSSEFSDENSFIINKSAVENFQMKDPVGKMLTVGDDQGTIIGVVKDFLFVDLDGSIPPSVFHLEKENLNHLLFGYDSEESFNDIHEYLKSEWNNFAPDTPLKCSTLGDYYNFYLSPVNTIIQMFLVIGLIAIFFSALGLLGLSSFIVERRTKEIGIRKVLGASVSSILWILSKEFMILVFLSNLIALPVVYIVWREVASLQYGFLAGVGPADYAVAALLSVITALLAIISQMLKTVNSNPVNALKYE
ncbi:ABC transporter permease [candidate division KSB1 bacterium]